MGKLVVDKVCADENLHDGMVTSVSYYNGYLYSAANDGKIKIFDSDLNFVRDVSVHEAFVYAIVVDQNGKLYTSSSDGTIKCVKEPLKSDDHTVILEHDNQGESLHVDENDVLYVGDNTGNVTAYENGKIKFTITASEAVKCVFVEKEILYVFTPSELSIYEMSDSGNVKKFNIAAKPPITLFGEKVDGRYKYAALLAPSGQEIIVLKNSAADNFETLTINEDFHDLTITAIEGAGEYLFSADYTGKVVLSNVEGNELKEFVNGSTGSGCCNCLAPLDDKNVFVGCTGGEIMKVAFNSGDKREFKWIRY